MLPRTRHVTINPDRLSFNDLVGVDHPIMGKYEAEAGYSALPTDITFRTVTKAGSLRVELHPDYSINLSPQGKVWTGSNKSASLLAHEEIHYYMGYVVARAAINEMLALRPARTAGLGDTLKAIVAKHMEDRGEKIQEAYDKATDHGTNAGKQSAWEKAMAACIANPSATALMGYDL